MSEVGSGQANGRLARCSTKSGFENTVISYDLSNRGIDISALYRLRFRDYDAYQGNANTTRIRTPW